MHHRLSKAIVALTVILAVGCSDSTIAPPAPTAQGADVTIPGGGATAALTQTDTLRFSFFIDPQKRSTYNLGSGNTITFPVGSLCDPKSSYGVNEWDKPCKVAKAAVTINTKAWLDASGYPHVDFDQHVRFAPTLDPAGWVMLTLNDYGAGAFPWTKIDYCPSMDASSCYDESVTDPSLATIEDPVTGALTRRLKHFSGYSLTSGRDAEMF